MKDELREILNDSTLLEVEVEYLADKLETLLAPTIEKAEKYDALLLIKDPIQVERELFQELVEKAKKWDKMKEITEMPLKSAQECESCQFNSHCLSTHISVCYYVKLIFDTLKGGQDANS